MGALAWLNPWAYKKRPTTDYDSVLARLATDITEAKTHLAEIKLRERRISLLLNLYGISLWVIWIGLYWLGGIPWRIIGLHDDSFAQIIELAVILVWPIGLLLFNRLLQFFYSRQRTREETHLRKLLKEQHTKLEEVKKATNYYATKELLDKYDETPNNSSRNSVRPGQANRAPLPSTPTPASRMTPGGRPLPAGARGLAPALPGQALGGQMMSPQQLQMVQQANQMHAQPLLPTPTKKWYDHLADKLMGEDPSTSQQTKYALVCARCFRHNGLLGDKAEWENTKWYCRNCNYFNPAPKDRKVGAKPPGIESNPPTPVLPSFPDESMVSAAGKDEVKPSKETNSVRRRVKAGEGDGDSMDVDEDEAGAS